MARASGVKRTDGRVATPPKRNTRASERRLRSFGREESVDRILDATVEAIGRRGLLRLSLSDVCRVAGVARGTLYRYFSTKEALLEGLGARERHRLAASVSALMERSGDPEERKNGVLAILVEQEANTELARLLEMEPAFVFDFFARSLPLYAEQIGEALGPYLRDVDALLGITGDPAMLAELVLRVRLSLLVMPASGRSSDLPARLKKMWDGMIDQAASPV
ncbi:hypothetical protein DSC91_007237 [Paraburkholderia caffeinilytica]|uniref:HTH tetR-type domain-containing protein n=1 Tax=Paraburkholderia caffeinilytica TaxID=1761016 RepID=A0ABQ1LMW2_9BURK|nr:hypothetical protein DSC91_007237 [Paraburkholderia caffeinilytica]GGC26976.1 hypothetical protein GCM10011400_11690 [Paraburkholderia caffeinilytica]CAB3779955.1 hypothetical protein LMG28690_00851 [Paraburkholderia caffeinilytica]